MQANDVATLYSLYRRASLRGRSDKGVYVVCVYGASIAAWDGDRLAALCISDARRVSRVGWGIRWTVALNLGHRVGEVVLSSRNAYMLIGIGCAIVKRC